MLGLRSRPFPVALSCRDAARLQARVPGPPVPRTTLEQAHERLRQNLPVSILKMGAPATADSSRPSRTARPAAAHEPEACLVEEQRPASTR
jgi:hypothetical protein